MSSKKLALPGKCKHGCKDKSQCLYRKGCVQGYADKVPVHIRGTKREGEVDIIVGEPRKGPRRAERKTINSPPRQTDCGGILRLPIRTLACAHGWNEVCERCVEGIAARAMYRAALSNGLSRVLRLDSWRASTDSQLRKVAGMQELRTTMAELQRQMILHVTYVCDGCVHCKENSNV